MKVRQSESLLTYQDTLTFLYSQLPMFQRIGKAAYKANLDNIILLCDKLGNPQDTIRAIHVAGTNGKGSVANMIASVFQEAGYKTGLYTSPHFVDFRERIRINGLKIKKGKVVAFTNQIRNLPNELQPSFFEVTTAMAFDYFAAEKVEIAIIETGMGGRLDSTNIIQPILSVITNISFDHAEFLGSDLTSIAREKAGIIKKNTPVIIGESQEITDDIFIKKANAQGVNIQFADQKIKIESWIGHSINICKGGKIWLNDMDYLLTGKYQIKNLTTALLAIDHVTDTELFRVTTAQIRSGITNMSQNTGFKGRWQTINKRPLAIADAFHNEAGLSEVLEQLDSVKYSHLHWVLGISGDKDVNKLLSMLPKKANYYYCKANVTRAMDVTKLKHKAQDFGLSGKEYLNVRSAYNAAIKEAKKDDLVFIGGSIFVLAELV